MKQAIADHYIVEFLGCDRLQLETVDRVKEVLLAAAEKSGAVILSYHFHQFQPFGVTGIILISESHFALHTYPEHFYCAFDVFTCGTMVVDASIKYIQQEFQAEEVVVTKFQRGC